MFILHRVMCALSTNIIKCIYPGLEPSIPCTVQALCAKLGKNYRKRLFDTLKAVPFKTVQFYLYSVVLKVYYTITALLRNKSQTPPCI